MDNYDVYVVSIEASSTALNQLISSGVISYIGIAYDQTPEDSEDVLEAVNEFALSEGF